MLRIPRGYRQETRSIRKCVYRKQLDLEQFAANWRPPSMSETIEWLFEDEKRRRAEPPSLD
jgi:hypothetical protein